MRRLIIINLILILFLIGGELVLLSLSANTFRLRSLTTDNCKLDNQGQVLCASALQPQVESNIIVVISGVAVYLAPFYPLVILAIILAVNFLSGYRSKDNGLRHFANTAAGNALVLASGWLVVLLLFSSYLIAPLDVYSFTSKLSSHPKAITIPLGGWVLVLVGFNAMRMYRKRPVLSVLLGILIVLLLVFGGIQLIASSL